MKTLKQIIDTKDIKKLLTISPTQTVIEALLIMAEYKIGALLVTDKSKMVGHYFRKRLCQGNHSSQKIFKRNLS